MARSKIRTNRQCYHYWFLKGYLILILVKCLEAVIKVQPTTPSSVFTFSKHSLSDDEVIRESVVIPVMDPEREAQELYEKSLREFGVFDTQTTKSSCTMWQNRSCQCTINSKQIILNCKGIGIVDIPRDIPSEVVNLNLGSNNITRLPARSFDMVPDLEELILSRNSIREFDPEAFLGLDKLKRLSLQNCGLTVIPGESLRRVPNLNSLNLGNNLLTIISEDDLKSMKNLIILLLKHNQLMHIVPNSFSKLLNLKVLELDDNLLSTLPAGLNQLPYLQELSASTNRIRSLNSTDLPMGLQVLDLHANPLSNIQTRVLTNMTQLKKLTLSDVRYLKKFPDLEGCVSLEVLRLDRAGLKEIPSSLCRYSPKLKSLELKANELTEIPDLSDCAVLRLLDLSHNKIGSLQGKPFQGLNQLRDLLLSDNQIKNIPEDAFFGIPKLQFLDIEGNLISFIHEKAFSHFKQLEDLNLGNNIFPSLPPAGLHGLLHLKAFNNPKLKEFPPPEVFPRIQTLVLSYAYHCCPFLPLVKMSTTRKPSSMVQETILFPSDTEISMTLWNKSMSDIWPQLQNLSTKFGNQINDLWESFGQDFVYQGNFPTYAGEYFEEEEEQGNTPARVIGSDITSGSIQCLPMPGPFLPCTDLFDWWTLRCGVWVVFLLALLGNGTVVFVLIFSRSKIDVPRFLVCNLAAADFFMGIYLGILAVVDASTLGEFKMYAIPWQMSTVCQAAGFLAVLSSELSVYTLAVITLERNYAITHAIHLNKRLSLKQAKYIMIVGWTFAIIMAVLPLVGVSDYRKFAVCLPFEITTGVSSLVYVVALMFINGCAFLTLMGCYLKMYWAIRGSQAWNTNDSRIAKRMALLVFTDFLCWSPIAFFSLSAIFGMQLISLEQAKIFTVFILPLNSCCNPFLYAIMTKQFKKDCVMICKAIEESRVSRTIGRPEHPLKELPPLLGSAPRCKCVKMMAHELPKYLQPVEEGFWSRSWSRLFDRKQSPSKKGSRRPIPYNYKCTEIRRKSNRTGSISSENFCSSRSSSWRNGPPKSYACTIPTGSQDPKKRHSAWLITRKTSQDSNLSSSRNDSSASATTASTSTFRLSRSSAGSTTPVPSIITATNKQNANLKPRLVRQQAVQEEEESTSPRLGVRFLPTIPSAADSSVILEEDSHDQSRSTQLYTVLQSDGTKVILSNPKSTNNKPP